MPSGTSATPMRFLSGSMLRISNEPVMPTATDRAHGSAAGRRERGRVRERFDARLEFDERAELREARHAAGVDLADLVGRRHRRPRIGDQLLQPERDLLRLVVDAQHLDGDLVAGLRPPTDPRRATSPSRRRAAGPARRRRDRRTRRTRAPRRRARQHRAGNDRVADLRGVALLLLLEQRPARDDEVPAAFLELDDAEGVDAAEVLRRIGGPNGVDLRERAEAALAGDADFVAALHLALDLAFDGEAGAESVLELPRRPRRAPASATA